MEQRVIKFRGASIETEEWVYGGYYRTHDPLCEEPSNDAYILITEDLGSVVGMESIEVIPKTVGQFTGLLDKNGKEIYEGDILKGDFATGHGGKSTKYKSFVFFVKWNDMGWTYKYGKIGDYRFFPSFEDCEVIGNIHETPELL